MWPISQHKSALNGCVVSELSNAKQYTWLRKELNQNDSKVKLNSNQSLPSRRLHITL